MRGEQTPDPDTTIYKDESDPLILKFVIEVAPLTQTRLRSYPPRENQVRLGLFLIMCALAGGEMSAVHDDRTLGEVKMAMTDDDSILGQAFEELWHGPERPELEEESGDVIEGEVVDEDDVKPELMPPADDTAEHQVSPDV